MLWTKENLFRKDIGINCTTIAQAKALLDWTVSIGESWYSSSGATYWSTYRENTCYRLSDNSYCYSSYFTSTHTIVKFTDLMRLPIISRRA